MPTNQAEASPGSASGGDFPSTHWSVFDVVRKAGGIGCPEVLDQLFRRYWKPVFFFLRRRGHSEHDAADLTQSFFMHALEVELFVRADRARGRFRSFLLSSLQNFVGNEKRAARAMSRKPKEGMVSIEALRASSDTQFDPTTDESPEEIFDRTWAQELLKRVLAAFETHCEEKSMALHFQIFRECIAAPLLGEETMGKSELAKRLGIDPRVVRNRLKTARDNFRLLLREEIETYASTPEEVDEEEKELLRLLAVRVPAGDPRGRRVS